MDFSDLVQKAIDLKGEEQIADLLKVAPSTLRGYVNNQYKPMEKTLASMTQELQDLISKA